MYEFDVMSRQPERGFYRLVVSTVTSDSRLVGHMAAQLTFKVLTAIDIQGVEVGTADSDRSTAPSLQKWVSRVVLSRCSNLFCQYNILIIFYLFCILVLFFKENIVKWLFKDYIAWVSFIDSL